MRVNKLETKYRVSKKEKKLLQKCAENRNGVKLGTIEAKPGITSADIKPQTFNGKIPWAAYKQQKQQSEACTNGWSDTEKATALIVSLRGQASRLILKVFRLSEEHRGVSKEHAVGVANIRVTL